MSSFPRATCLQKIDVYVLAGGLGTRIRPVLGDVPKLLAPIRGRPYLSYLLDWLKHFGARRIVLGLGHRAEAIAGHLKNNPLAGLEVETTVEPRPLGTAGALRFARALLRTDPVLVINGDSFADVDLCAFVAKHRTSGAQGALLCAEVNDAGRYGRLVLNEQGRITGFVEKDSGFRGTATINAGMYLISASFLDSIADGDAVSLERDVFERQPPGSLLAFRGCTSFIDIGTPESLLHAEKVFDAVGEDDARTNTP